MTDKEIKAIRFVWKSHTSMEHEHCTVYLSTCGRFGMCVHVPYKYGRPYGRPYIHYRIGDIMFKTEKAFRNVLRQI